MDFFGLFYFSFFILVQVLEQVDKAMLTEIGK